MEKMTLSKIQEMERTICKNPPQHFQKEEIRYGTYELFIKKMNNELSENTCKLISKEHGK